MSVTARRERAASPAHRSIARASLVLRRAPDDMHLIYGVTAGLVGKKIDCDLLDVRTGETRKAERRYLSGVLLTDASRRPSEP